MEYHWYEDYWDIPRRSPKGHVTGSGYYITGRLSVLDKGTMQSEKF